MMNLLINNLPITAKDHPWVVARGFEGRLWFWGAYDNEAQAREVAMDLGEGAVCLPNLDWAN